MASARVRFNVFFVAPMRLGNRNIVAFLRPALRVFFAGERLSENDVLAELLNDVSAHRNLQPTEKGLSSRHLPAPLHGERVFVRVHLHADDAVRTVRLTAGVPRNGDGARAHLECNAFTRRKPISLPQNIQRTRRNFHQHQPEPGSMRKIHAHSKSPKSVLFFDFF